MATQAEQIIQAITQTFGTVEKYHDFLQLSKAITQITVDVFDSDPNVYKASLNAIKVNTDEVTRQNEVAKLRKQQREFNEQIEAQIQQLLGMK